MKTINFVLDKDKKITIQIPDLPNKVNYYYEPTEKIHKFDEGTVSFVDKDFNIETTTNSLDAVSDRDFIIEIISALSIISMHLSRMAEDFIIWSTKEFDFIEMFLILV